MSAAPKPRTRLKKLESVLDGAKTMLIVMQNNPDPDAIAAAAALKEIARQRLGIACSVAHGGLVGRAENQALLRYLGLNTRSLEELDLGRFDRLAMVDAQPGAGNVTFDPAVRLDVVIDHHPIRRVTRSARFTDVRSRYGATCSILHEYLRAAGVAIDPPLATAMVYGIRSDTQDLGRDSTRADVEAFLDLYPKANPRVLGRIVSAQLPRSYFDKLRRAIDNASIYGTSIVSTLAELDSPEMIAEAADLLLRVEDVDWSLCFGVIEDWLHLSLRTTDREADAGRVARNLAGRKGFGGGHQALAASQIPLGPVETRRESAEHLIERLTRRFLRASGAKGSAAQPLCDPDG